MKANKNPESEENIYRYIYEDSEWNTREELIIPGKDGVKDEHIEMLYFMDNQEDYNEAKNKSPKLTRKEKRNGVSCTQMRNVRRSRTSPLIIVWSIPI